MTNCEPNNCTHTYSPGLMIRFSLCLVSFYRIVKENRIISPGLHTNEVHKHINVHLHQRAHTCTYSRMCLVLDVTCIHTHTTYTHIPTRTHVDTKHTQTHTRTHTNTHTRTHTCIYVFTYVWNKKYTHTHMHPTHTHVY